MNFRNLIIIISFFITVFPSCTGIGKNSLRWEKTASEDVEFVVTSKKSRVYQGKNGIVLMPYGKIKDGKIIKDSSCRFFEGFTDRLLQALKNENEIKHLGSGSTGFCRVGFYKMLDSFAVLEDSIPIKENLEISIWFPYSFQPKDSTKEIHKLQKYGAFETVSYIFKGIQLGFKERFLNKKSVDSLIKILHENYPDAEIKSPNFQQLLPENSSKAEDAVFEFTIIGF